MIWSVLLHSGQAMARPSTALAGRHAATRGDYAPRPDGLSLSECMNFKASIGTKLLRLTLNRLHNDKEGLLGYQSELKHDITS